MSRLYDRRNLEAALGASGISDAAATRIRASLNDLSDHSPSRDRATDRPISYSAKSMFAAFGILVVLAGLMIIARMFVGSFAGLIVAALAFAVSAHFHARGEGIPLMVLLAGSVFGIADMSLGLITSIDTGVAEGAPFEAEHSAIMFGAAAITAAAFWLAYRLPLAFAVMMAAILVLGGEIAIIIVGTPSTWNFVMWPTGFAVISLALACWHDMSDVYRETSRSDVAFWLHVIGGITIAGQFFLLYESFAHPGPPIATSLEQITMTSPAASCVAMMAFLSYFIYAVLFDRVSMALIGTLFLKFTLFSLLGLDLFAISLTITGIVAIILAAMWQQIRGGMLQVLPLIARAQLPRTAPRVDGKRPVE